MTIRDNDKVRDDVQSAIAQTYFETKRAALNSIYDALSVHNYAFLYLDCDGDSGRKNIPLYCFESGRFGGHMNNMLVFSWHKMPSGRFEITAYLS